MTPTKRKLTPMRQKVEALLAALNGLRRPSGCWCGFVPPSDGRTFHTQACMTARAAIVKAEGKP